VADHFYVTLGIGEYESKQVTRLATGGADVLRPWEGETTDRGISLTIDVNNRLRAQLRKQFTRVDAEEIRAMNRLAFGIVEHVAQRLVADGVLDLSAVRQVYV
jgi:hypothetical protein